jgi:hypothetical protein
MPRRCSNVREYRVKAEFTRVIDTLVHRKRVAPAIGLLLLPPHSPVRVTSCLYHRGQARYTII